MDKKQCRCLSIGTDIKEGKDTGVQFDRLANDIVV